MAFSVRSVMVTGANKGLGLEFIKQMLAFPSPPEVMIATCRDPGAAKDLQTIAKSNPRLKIIKLDVEKDEDIERAFTETKTQVGEKGLNILINNAGLYEQANDGALRYVTRESMQKHFNVNVSGQLLITQKFLPLLELAVAERGSRQLNCHAQVVIMASVVGSQTLTYQGAWGKCFHYMCSKTAATMASVLLSRELRDAGIHVLPLHPGWVRTDMGGSDAPLSVQESISGCLKVIGASSADTTGKFLNNLGEEIPY